MKRILFVIPSLETGGTNSSLNSLFPILNKTYDVSVFPLTCNSNGIRFSFCRALLSPSKGLSFLYSNFKDQHGFKKLVAIWFKCLRSLYRMVGKEYGTVYGRHVVRHIEKQNVYDYVVAFQEGYTTSFTTLFQCPNKIAWIHCDYSKYLPHDRTEEALYSVFQRVVCVSEYTRKVFTQYYPSLANRTLAIHNLIDTVRIRLLSREPIDDNRFILDGTILLSVGRFTSVKRFREIPRVAATLKNNGISFVWYILGPADISDESILFSENIQQYGVQDCVKWLGSKTNPYPYFKESNLYICLSESEACPMVFKEALLFGLPIVTTDFPSSVEFIKESNGIISSFEKLPESIAIMINRIKNGFRLSEKDKDDNTTLERLYELFE